MFRLLPHFLFCCVGWFSAPSLGDELSYRTWVDSTGKHKVTAALVKQNGDQVQLKRKDNGQVITLDLKRLSKSDQVYLQRTAKQSAKKQSSLAKSSKNQSNEKSNTDRSAQMDKSAIKSKAKSGYQLGDKLLFTGSWNNRKYGTSGSLRCSAVVKDQDNWTAKFDGNGVYGKFSYDVVIATKDRGKQLQLQGNSSVSGHRYRWTGNVKNGILFGKYTATNGNNGTFRLTLQ